MNVDVFIFGALVTFTMMEKKRWVIGISGGSGSGKTSVIRALQEKFSPGQLCVISQDDYYKSVEQQVIDTQGVVNFDLPGCFEVEAFRSDLDKLIQGEVVTREEYTFNNDQKKPDLKVFHPAPVIIVEGLFVFHFPEVREILDIKVFIEANDALKIKRRILRDQLERNYPIEDVLYRYEYHVIPAYRNYIAPYSATADVIINNHDTFEKGLMLLESFIFQRQVD